VLRTYTKEEILVMIDSLQVDNFKWSIGSTKFMLVFRTTCIFGWKEAQSEA
jgi:hypothetical protein